MNKYQEALNNLLKFTVQWADCSEEGKVIQELVDYYSKDENAKQIPKNVTREVIGMITHVQCPTCKRVMRHETSGTILRFCTNHKHCSVCGQALDWTVE